MTAGSVRPVDPSVLPAAVLGSLRCPDCDARMVVGEGELRCRRCARSVLLADPLDLRPSSPRRVDLAVTVGTPGPDPATVDLGPLRTNPAADVDHGDAPLPRHVSRELRSWVPAARRADSVALDLGCGTALHRGVLERAGHAYVGVDWSHPGAPVLADAHVLPFEDATFDLVFTVATFEHLHTPVRAMQEVARVLRPGGQLVGTVAFLEPYHDRSYFHHSALGVLHLLAEAGLSARFVATSPSWTVLDAQPKALLPGSPPALQRGLAAVARVGWRSWWAALRLRNRAYFTDERRLLSASGSFTFVADAPS